MFEMTCVDCRVGQVGNFGMVEIPRHGVFKSNAVYYIVLV